MMEDSFVREASVVIHAGALRDALGSLKRCKVVGISTYWDAAVLFAVDSRERCVDARKVPATVDGTPMPVYLQRRSLKDALDVPGDEVRIDWLAAQEPIRIVIGDAVEYIAAYRVKRSRQACAEAWEIAR